MLVDAERSGLTAGWAAAGQCPGWIWSLASGVQVLAAIAAVYLAWASLTPIAYTAAITIIGLAGIGGFAAFANRWTQAALADRLDILVQALDMTADAQILAAPNGQVTYANAAFQHMFPCSETPLDRIERSQAADSESIMEFRRLRGRAPAGVRATAALSLRDRRDGSFRPIRWRGRRDPPRRSIAQNPPGPHRPRLDWAERCRGGRGTAHAIGGLRPDARARVEGRTQIGPPVSALLR